MIWLSVCVPTRNRAKKLQNMLQGLLPQLDEGVEVIILDDSDEETTKKYAQSLPNNFRYFKGVGLGVDQAALSLVEMAVGDYIWFFSDDDEWAPGALKKLREIVKEKSYSTIWANFAVNELDSLAVDMPERAFNNPDEALRCLGLNVSLISTQIIRRRDALASLDFASRHVHGFSFASTALFLSALGSGGTSYFFRGPALICHPNTIEDIKEITTSDGVITNNNFQTYGEYYTKLLVDLPSAFSASQVRSAVKQSFSSLWRGMIVGWVGGWDTPKNKRVKMLRLYWSYPESWVALTLFILPRQFVAILFRFYKVFFSHRTFVFFDRFKGKFWK